MDVGSSPSSLVGWHRGACKGCLGVGVDALAAGLTGVGAVRLHKAKKWQATPIHRVNMHERRHLAKNQRRPTPHPCVSMLPLLLLGCDVPGMPKP